MGILQNYNEGNMDALRSVKYSETGTQAPYVVKDIKDPPANNDKTIGLQLNTRIDDTSRIAQMLIDKPGLKFVGNQALLSASELASKAKAAASKKRGQKGGATNIGAALAGAASAAGQVLKIVGSTLAQVPVNGTGTHFVRGFTPDTYIKSGDPSGLLGFLGADGESGAAKALDGAKIIPDGDPQKGLESFPIEDAYRVSKGIDSTTGALGLGDISSNRYSEKDSTLDELAPQDSDYLDSNYSAQERQYYAKNGQTIIPDNVSSDYIPPISSNLKVSGSSTPFGNIETELSGSRVDTPTAPLAQTGSVITIQGGTATTATKKDFGTTNQDITGDIAGRTGYEVGPINSGSIQATKPTEENISNAQIGVSIPVVKEEGAKETTATSGSLGTSSNVPEQLKTVTGDTVEITPFKVDPKKAKGSYTDQQNTQNARGGKAIKLEESPRETTAATDTFGTSNIVSASAETVTGFQEIQASVFSVDEDKAKGRSTTQNNTLFALTGSTIPLKGDTRETTESPGQGLIKGRINKVPTTEGDITGPGSRETNRYSSGSSFTTTNTADNIRSMQKGQISFNDGNIPLRDNANLDTVSETSLSRDTTGEYDGTTKSVGRGVAGDIQDFRNPDSENKYNGGISNSYPLNYALPTINKETRVGLGNQGKKKNLTSYSITDPASVDKINYLDVKNERVISNVHTPDEQESSRDFIKFNFQIITPEDTTFLYFRAFLTELSDSYQGSWDTSKYLGRAESFYTYQGFDRSISIGFNIAAATRKEMKPLYRKMAALASVTAPTYGADGKFMRGTIAKVTVGDYIYELPGIIESVDYSWNTDYNWEIAFQNQEGNVDDDMQELPQIMDCSIKFKPIHSFIPEAVGKDRLLPYITNPTANGSDKAIFIPQP